MDRRKDTRRAFLKGTGAVALAMAASSTVEALEPRGVQAREAATDFDVKRFGAAGDGKTLDSPSINRAIAAAAAAGGGTVQMPAGSYLCRSIRLKSNVTLQFASGTMLIAAEPEKGASGYDPAESNGLVHEYQDFGHSHWQNSLIWGDGLENISICGPGLIWGKGISRGEFQGPIAEIPGVANKAIGLKRCHGVTLRDFSILHGGHFGILATGVDNLTIDNVKIDTNRAGIDMDCCRNVRVTKCSINAPWDDAICLKSSLALGFARGAEMITISDCMVSGSFEEGSLLDGTFKRFSADADIDRNGRIKLGTESNGAFKNITITNCVFDGCLGLAILSVDGAVIEDLSISNITMRETVASPIFIRLGSRMRAPTATPVGAIRRVNISNLVSSSTSSLMCSMIAGIPGHRIENIKLSNILLQHSGGGTRYEASRQLEEREKEYPEPYMFGNTPAHGLFIRHAQDIEVSSYRVIAPRDHRPCISLVDVAGADFFNIKAERTTNAPIFVLDHVQEFRLAGSLSLPDTQLLDTNHQEL